MLTQIRHIQKGVLIVVCIVIVIAFAFLYSDYDAGSAGPGGNTAFVAYGKSYRNKEARVLQNSYSVAQRLFMFEFVGSLFGERRQDNDKTDYVINLVVLREEAKKLGIQPSSEEVRKAIPNLPVFKIQKWAGEEYIRNNITGPMGFTDADLYQLVKDYLSWQQIRELLASGIEPTPEEIDQIYIRNFQRISGSVIAFSKEEEEKKLKITDKDIETYYNENKDSMELLSDEMRRGSYVHFKLAELKADATNEQKAEHKEKVIAFKKMVAAVYEEMVADGADFKKVVAKHKLKPVETGEVSLANIPKEIEEKPNVLRALFQATTEQALSAPVMQQDGSYYVIHLDELKAPALQPLKGASQAIKEILKVRKGDEQLQATAAKAQSTINEALVAGKSFDEAAKLAGVKPVKLMAFSNADPPKKIDNARLIVGTAAAMNIKELSGIVKTPTGAMLVYVDKKVIYESKEEERRKEMIRGQLSYGDSKTLYDAWFQEKREAAHPKRTGPIAQPQS
ncbi:MAG: hypothetical protein GXP30_03430 [Verrucomicrobia bacterium]|nr:hypothetical protein [Verrucomicrobiota bacterium]